MINAEVNAASDPLGALLQWGPFALVVMLAIVGYVRFRPEVDALRADKQRLERQVETLTDQYTQTVLPTVTAAVDAIRETARRVETSTQTQARMTDSLASLTARIEALERLAERLRESLIRQAAAVDVRKGAPS